MRILHIGNEMSWRGGENQVRLLIQGLKLQNIETFVAYPSTSRGCERFADLTETLPLPSRSPYDPRNVWRLTEFCKVKKIDLLDAHSSGGMSWALAVKKKLPSLKVVVHRRVDNVIKRNFFTKRKYLSPQVDKFVCISNAIAQILRDYGIPEDKIITVRSAVEESPYTKLDKMELKKRVRREHLLNGQTVLIGNASALTSQKGHDVLIRACQILQKRGTPFHCFIAGEGALEKPLKALTHELGVEKSVTFLGHIQKVQEFLSALDVLVVPSRNEGLGTILLEGAFAGCALVGAEVGGIPEIVKPGETGLSVMPGDFSGLAAQIEKLVQDEKLRMTLSENARAYVRHAFSLEQMVNGNLRVYRSLLPAHSRLPNS